VFRRIADALFPIGRFSIEERKVVFIMWAVGIGQGYAQSNLSATIPFTRAALGLSEAEMSLILAVTRLAGFGALAFATWGDRRGRKIPLIAAFIGLMVADFATGLSNSATLFTIMQSLVRITGTALGTLAVVLIAEEVRPRTRAFAISLYGAGGSFGAGLGLLVLPLADLADGWRLIFSLSALALIIVPFLFRSIHESPIFEIVEQPARRPLLRLLASPFARVFWLSAIAVLLASAFSSVGLAFSTERLVDDLGYSTTAAVVISLIGGTLGGLGFFVGGRMADVVGRKITTIFSLALVLVGGITLYYVESLPLIVLAIVASTFGTFAFVPASASHRAELFPTEFRASGGTAGAYLAMVGSAIGLGIGAITIGRIGLSATVLLLGIGVVAAIALTMLLPETMGQELDHVEAEL
jgi:SHS family lactate transporter-like MFS transporter